MYTNLKNKGLINKTRIEISRQLNNIPRISLNDEAINLLNNYNWPGNIRELQNLILRLLIANFK